MKKVVFVLPKLQKIAFIKEGNDTNEHETSFDICVHYYLLY